MNPLNQSLPALNNLTLKQIRDITPEDLFRLALSDNLGRVKIITLDLTTAGSQTFNYAGNYVKMTEATDGNVRVNIKYNRPDDDTHSFRLNTREIRPFTQLFFSWTAQSGKSATFILAFDGTNRLYDHDSFDPASNISTLGSITGDIAKLTAIPSGATIVRARAFSYTASPAITTIYTVTSGKTLYISKASLRIDSGGSVHAFGEIIVTDASDVYQYSLPIIAGGVGINGVPNYHSTNWLYPETVQSGYKVKLRKRSDNDADDAGGHGTAIISGFEL